MAPIVALPDPEIRHSADEAPPTIGPNLASDPNLAKAVTKFVTEQYWYPQLWSQQPFWPMWDRVDSAWRCGAQSFQMQLETDRVTPKAIKEMEPQADGFKAKGQNVMFFKQVKAIVDAMEQLSFDNGLPVRAEVPEDVDEDDFYQPTKQSAKAANSLLEQTAEEISFRDRHRRSAGSFARYGLAWAMTPFDIKYEKVEVRHNLGIDPMQAQMKLEALQMASPAQYAVEQQPEGFFAVTSEIRMAALTTDFRPVKISDVLIDPLLPCTPIERQPCPFVREHITQSELEANRYDPQYNPFGYVNIEEACRQEFSHYTLSMQDEGPLRDMLRHRFNISDTIGPSVKTERIRQKWTAFPLLRIGPNGQIDDGQGIECPTCAGKKDMVQPDGSTTPCPTCAGTGRVHPPAERYVAVFYGGISLSTVCVRLQKLPEKMEIPLVYAADLVEDDSCAYPMSKSEAALTAIDQLTKAECQFEDSKQYTIDRPWGVKDDSPSAHIQNFNKVRVYKYETSPEEVTRADGNTYDESATLLPYIERRENQVQQIMGATDTLLGMLSPGRRSALEIGEATDAAKNPIVLLTDRFNRKMVGGWARQFIKNIELFGDKDFIRRKTGREFFGRVRIFTAVGQEFIKKVTSEQNLRWLLQASPTIPALQPIMPPICNRLLKLMGFGDINVPDGGLAKAQSDGMRLVSQILGDGQMIPPDPSDPHEVFLQIFTSAIKDPYWLTSAPQNLPLLMQRIQMQQQLLLQQQMQMLQAQMLQNQLLPDGGGRGNQPGGPSDASEDAGGQMQQAQG